MVGRSTLSTLLLLCCLGCSHVTNGATRKTTSSPSFDYATALPQSAQSTRLDEAADGKLALAVRVPDELPGSSAATPALHESETVADQSNLHGSGHQWSLEEPTKTLSD